MSFCELSQAYKATSDNYGSTLQGGTECRLPVAPPSVPVEIKYPSLTERFTPDRCEKCGKRQHMDIDDLIIIGLAATFIILYMKKD